MSSFFRNINSSLFNAATGLARSLGNTIVNTARGVASRVASSFLPRPVRTGTIRESRIEPETTQEIPDRTRRIRQGTFQPDRGIASSTQPETGEAVTVRETIRGSVPEGYRTTNREGAEYVQIRRPDGSIAVRRIDDRFESLINGELTPTSSSDQETISLMEGSYPIRYLAMIREPEETRQTENTGAWFPYLLKEDIPLDLTKYGIYKRSDVRNTKNQIEGIFSPEGDRENCFVKLFANHPRIQELKLSIHGKYTPQSDIKKTANLLGATITLHKYARKRKLIVKYVPTEPFEDYCYEICLLEKHYFPFEITEYKYSYITHQAWKTGYKPRSTSKYMTSFALVSFILEHKEDFLEEYGEDIFKTNYFVPDKIDFTERWEIKPGHCMLSKPPRAKEGEEYTDVFYADLETYSFYNKHYPYLFAIISESTGEKFWYYGENCIKKGLQYLSRFKRPLIYFHNLGYDSTFIVDKLFNPSSLNTSLSRCIMMEGNFGKTKLTFHDSLAHINAPLRDFDKMFNLQGGKFPDFPYSLFTKDVVEKEYLIDNGQYDMIPEEYHVERTIKKNVLKIVDHKKYAIDYCIRDVEVLRDGFRMFKGWILDELNINIDYVLTSASLAHKYLEKEGCYSEVKWLSGMTREFIQKCVVGGRTTLSMNDEYKYEVKKIGDKPLYDFDAVSLYPSAMMRFDGCPMGDPVFIEHIESKLFMHSDMYFVKIRIDKVGRKLKLPLMSYVKDNGNRCWENDMVGKLCYVDKYTLEDWIKYHEIEFTPIIGLEFNKGFNTKIVETMKKLFQLRLKLKAEGNPAEQVYKLIMNSAYGKTIEKPHLSGVKYVPKFKFAKFMKKNYGIVSEFSEMENNYRCEVDQNSLSQQSRPHVGSCILSMSKRIMAEVTTVADDHIYYTDTDSIFISKEGLDLLPETLIGKNPGQFHVDFAMKGTNVRAVEGIYIAPKTYCLKLVNDEGEIDYHIRMKGISKNAYEEKVKEFDGDYIALFEYMLKNKVVYNLLAGDKVRFDFKKNMSVFSLKSFERELGPFIV